MKKNIFTNFTNLYEISKTLRFELKMAGWIINEDLFLSEQNFKWKTWTEYYLAKNEVFGKDQIILESYKRIKPYLDKLHRIFIDESLENLVLDFSEAEQKFLELQNETEKSQKDKNKKELEKIFKSLREKIEKNFEKTWNIWENKFIKKLSEKKWTKNIETKWNWYKILLSDKNLDILNEFFSEETEWENVLIKNIKWEKINIFKSFKGFTTYFSNFNESRKNFYLWDWKSWRIATRIINENLTFFLKNKKNFDEKYKENQIFIEKFNEILNNYGENIEAFFNLNFYNKCYTWKQIEYYNQLIWELNSIINLQKQADYSKYIQWKKENKTLEFKKSDYPLFKELYKQILSEKDIEKSFIEIEDFCDIKKYLQEFQKDNSKRNEIAKNLINNLVNNFEIEFDISKIFISKISLNTISAKYFWSDNWNFVQEKLLGKTWNKNKNWKLELPDFIDLKIINDILEEAQNEKEKEKNIFKDDFNKIEAKNSFEKFLKIFFEELYENIKNSETYWWEVEKNILTLENFSKASEEKEKQIEIIKNYLDSNLNIFRMMKYFALEKGKENLEAKYEIDENFYKNFKKFYLYNEIITYYNEFRNFLTKKPFSQDKIKLNFEKWTLLNGWDKNKEPDNFWTLLKKDWKYFLALQSYWTKNIFYKKKWSSVEDIKEAYELKSWESFFEKMEYKYLPDPKKNFPKIFFAKSNLKIFNPSEEILNIKKNETFKIWEKFIIEDFYKIVDFFKENISKYPDWKIFNFNFSDTKSYKNLSNFYKEVEIWSYKLNFRNISEKYIYENIEKWNIYLFEIYNKDFSAWSKWKQNLHTMYFKWLFEENNLKNIVLKLNWQAEIFRRKASISDPIFDTERKAKVVITEHKRYTEDKLFFHCPISLNFAKYEININDKILELINKNENINIIWIDRWEKHLAYYSVIDPKWNILKDENWKLIKWSFNIIDIFWKNNEKISEKNYYDELVKRENERKEARWSWKSIKNIKELKEWYISQVVHKLTELIIKYNAIIVFEDLNSWFKQSRQKIERQIYQKLEKALIEKLNYLTFKDKNFWEAWHYLLAYQLTAPFESFEKVWKQTWIIFYTDPSYTSQTCPSCWFRKDLYLKYSNLKNAIWDIEKINSITFEKWRFIFKYNNRKVFSDRNRKRNISSIERWVKWWKTVDDNITENLEKLFEEFNINFKNWENIILQIQEANEKKLYQKVFENFNAILKIRNSTIWDNSREWDFICCPSCDFDSRFDTKIWIENWDDNWAYNIARKWIIILDKINKAFEKKKEASKIKWEDMIVKQEDWDKFLWNK